jgi:hypothetical protein
MSTVGFHIERPNSRNSLRFLYDFVTFPNGVFSGTIISSVVKDKSIKKTAEWQLLLGAIALPGCLVGAWLCNRLGRPKTMMLGFSGIASILHNSGECSSNSESTRISCFRSYYWMQLRQNYNDHPSFHYILWTNAELWKSWYVCLYVALMHLLKLLITDDLGRSW